MANATIPFQGSVALPMPPPRPPGPSGPLPIMEELEWLRSAVEMQQRSLKYMIDNYNGLLAKAEAEGMTPGGEPTFGAPQTFAIGALVPAGRWLVTAPGTVAQALTAGQFVTLTAQGSATTAITMMTVT